METLQDGENRQPFFPLRGKKKYLFGFLIYLVVLAAIPVSVHLVGQRQEIRKYASGNGCADDWQECLDLQTCVQKDVVSEKLIVSCDQFPDLLVFGSPVRACFSDASNQEKHQLSTTVSKDLAYQDKLVEVNYAVNFFSCPESCGVTIRGGKDLAPNWCACLENRQVKRGSLTLQAGGQPEVINETMSLLYGKCGSAEIDVWVENVKVDGVSVARCNKGPVWSLWLSDRPAADCQ